jgi:hypothetical protein
MPAWLSARLNRSAGRAIVGLSPGMSVFIHGSLQPVDEHHIYCVEREMVQGSGHDVLRRNGLAPRSIEPILPVALTGV